MCLCDNQIMQILSTMEERDHSCGISIVQDKKQNIPHGNMNKNKDKKVEDSTEYFSKNGKFS